MQKPSAFDDFLYLLSELERVIGKSDFQLPSPQVGITQDRLARIAAKLAQATRRDTDKGLGIVP